MHATFLHEQREQDTVLKCMQLLHMQLGIELHSLFGTRRFLLSWYSAWSSCALRRSYHKHHPLLVWSPRTVLLCSRVLGRELVDVVVSFLSRDLLRDLATDGDVLVRVSVVENPDGHPRVPRDVLGLLPSERGVDKDVLAVGVYPDRRELWAAVFVQGRQKGEVLRVQEPLRL